MAFIYRFGLLQLLSCVAAAQESVQLKPLTRDSSGDAVVAGILCPEHGPGCGRS